MVSEVTNSSTEDRDSVKCMFDDCEIEVTMVSIDEAGNWQPVCICCYETLQDAVNAA